MLVYKVLTKSDFDFFFIQGQIKGSASDLQDGFIHFSTREQLCSTIKKHFNKCAKVFVLAFRESELGTKLRWETSRNLELFPHYYDSLKYSQALYTIQLKI